MRIIHALEGHTWSGGQQQALFLVQEQIRQGHEVLLMCQSGSELEQRAAAAGLPVHAHDYRSEMNPRSVLGLLRAFDSFRPEVVNVHRAWAHTQWVLVSLLRRFRGLIVTRRVLFRPEKNPLSAVKYRTPAVRGYIAVSRAVAERLREVGVASRRICVVYSASDTERFDPDLTHALSGPWPIPRGTPAALLIGNFHPNKGHELLLQAFAEVSQIWPELHLVLAGTGTDGARLQELRAAHPAADRIHLLGFRPDVPALLQHATFSVNASFQEGFAGTIRESLAMNVPVVASAIPANLEMNELIPLTLFPCGNAAGLARSVLRMKEAPRPDVRTEAVRRFSVPAMVDRTVQAYHSFVGNSG